jgi:hypothetical protein
MAVRVTALPHLVPRCPTEARFHLSLRVGTAEARFSPSRNTSGQRALTPFVCEGVGAAAGTWDGIDAGHVSDAAITEEAAHAPGESVVPSTSRSCCTGDRPACMLTGDDK